MADRTDPMPSLARTVLSVEKKAASLDARATFGRLRVEPNGTNAIASHLTAWLDARAPTREQLALILAAIPPTFGLTVTAESVTPGCTFDPALRARIADLVGNPPQVATGAGHDSGILAGAGLPTAMLFVRNPTGVSHSPEEYASPEDCQSGAEALASVLIDLSNAK
jgi:N-carbamoyl-L-amino-acid hydrolase